MSLYHRRWEHESAYYALRHTLMAGRILRSGDRAGVEQEMWSLLTLYQALRTVMVDAAGSLPGTAPDRCGFTIALQTARDQVIGAADIVTANVNKAGLIERRLLAGLLPRRRQRVSTRKVKSPISRYSERRDDGRPNASSTVTDLDITIVEPPQSQPAPPTRSRDDRLTTPTQRRRHRIPALLQEQPDRLWSPRDIAAHFADVTLHTMYRQLDKVTQDLAANGLVDFSLRRAARSAGTTHKVLLYYFDGVDDLLKQAVVQLRGRRIEGALAAAQASGHDSLADRVQSMWPVLTAVESGQLALDQAIGLAMYDPDRYAELGRGASELYLPSLRSICPEHWPDRRKEEVSQMILAALRGFLSTGAPAGPPAGSTPGSRPWSGHLSGRRPRRTEVRSKGDLGTKRELKRIQYRPELIDGCLAETGRIMTAT